jgi:SM-20-related protein
MSAIRSTLNVDELNRRFIGAQRLRCAGFLEQSCADSLRKCLEEDVNWSVMLVDNERINELRYEERDGVKDDLSDIARKAYESAGRGYSFYFESNRRTSGATYGEQRIRAALPPVLDDFRASVNKAENLEFFRRVTSMPDITRAELMATRFSPGHFLLAHNDIAEHRKAAFVINLTSDWKPTWGGLLQFLSEEGQVVDTFVPEFNTLHLFGVPQIHTVSFVAPFAQRSRYAISGWLYSK